MNMQKKVVTRQDLEDAIADFRAVRFDANETVFLARQLEQIRAKSYDIKYAPLDAVSFLPVDTSISEGVEAITYRQYEMFAMAKIVSDYANDFPTADVVAREFASKVKSLGDSYQYSIQEMRAAQFAGVPLEQRKANAARRGIDQKHNAIAKSGSAADGLLGFLNQSNTTAFNVPNGAAGTATWATKTPDEIVADMFDIAQGIVTSTKGVEIPDTLLLPLAQHGLISTRRMGDGSDATILEHFLKASPWVKSVLPWHELAGAGTGPTDRMVCYRKDPDALQYIMPVPFEQFAPQQQGMVMKTHCHARTGGVVVYYPLSISYGDGI